MLNQPVSAIPAGLHRIPFTFGRTSRMPFTSVPLAAFAAGEIEVVGRREHDGRPVALNEGVLAGDLPAIDERAEHRVSSTLSGRSQV